MIALTTCTLEFTELGAVTRWRDGSMWGATPHDEPHYHHLAFAYGHEGDVMAYCRAHELAHHLIAEHFGHHSPTLWALAHGEQPTPMIAAAEEALAMALHRYALTGQHPFVDCIPWERLRDRFLNLWGR